MPFYLADPPISGLLQVHRIIKETLRGRYNETRREHYESLLPVIATETSRLERRADEVERE